MHTKDIPAYFWRHPRRTGFIAFNVVMILALWVWAEYSRTFRTDGLMGLPNLMLGYTSMVFVLTVWVVGWIAWGVMVVRRIRAHAHHPNPPPGQ